MEIIVKDFADFRQLARPLISAKALPQSIFWKDAHVSEPLLPLWLESDVSLTAPSNSLPAVRFTVPPAFIKLGETVEVHRSGKQWSHLYSLLFKIRNQGPEILSISVDDDVYALEIMAKQIKRDIHKMHAFVRFRKKEILSEDLFIAWHEPDHRILSKAAPFFVRRFGSMSWIIATPDGAAYWDQHHLQLHEAPTHKKDYLVTDDHVEDFWLTYYANVFNPARVKINAMKKEMPVRYWKNLPEGKLITSLIANASTRVEEMHVKLKKEVKSDATRFVPPIDLKAPAKSELAKLNHAAKNCEGCPLYKEATHTVFGHGNPNTKVMLVGEQPGNDEDLKGLPFVGPAGKLLRAALAELEIDESELYFTNAVKHFSFTQRGKFRLHKRPQVSHIRACKPWIEKEIEVIKPKLIVCLGATATQSVIGFPLNINQERGKRFKTQFGMEALVTFHPSYLLRVQEPDEHEQLKKKFRQDLLLIKEALLPHSH